MTRGNQRDIDRARALARHAGKGTPAEGDPTARRLADANALQAKVEAKRKAEAEEAARLAAEEEYKKALSAGGAARPAAAAAAGAAAAPAEVKKVKKKEDLSFLDAALASNPTGKKK